MTVQGEVVIWSDNNAGFGNCLNACGPDKLEEEMKGSVRRGRGCRGRAAFSRRRPPPPPPRERRFFFPAHRTMPPFPLPPKKTHLARPL